MASIEKAVDFMFNIARDNTHGYDQSNRNGPDYDCSSLVATALNKAGFNVSIYSWTGNLKEQLLSCGFKPCSAPWKAGDIHLNERHHVAMSISETQIVQASINEKGTVRGGETGDQTGREIWVCPYYDYPWDIHLRYQKTTKNSKSVEKLAKEVIHGDWGNGEERRKRLTDAGYDYQTIQDKVNEMLRG